MRRISLYVLILLGAFFTACQEDNIKVADREYIIFQDTLSFRPVLSDENYSFSVPIASTVACDYDRTIAVEIIDEGSNAVEGRDYRLESNTVTIPAGEYGTSVTVYPQYDRFEDDDTLSFNLKLVMPECRLWAWDNSPAALGTARRNASAKDIDIVVEYQDVLDIRTAERRWDVIVSNPPYVLNSEKKDIEEHVLKHEPAEALFVPDGDPLRFYTPIARYAAKTLRPGGALYFELNPLTADKTAEMARREGFAEAEIREDCYGKRRMMKAGMAD